MVEIIKTLLKSLNKNKLETSDVILTVAALEMVLEETDLKLDRICLIQLLLNQLDCFKEDVDNHFILKQRVAETKLKVLRLGLAQLDNFADQPMKRIKNNVQITTPTKDLGAANRMDVFEYEDGTIEEKEIFNIHPQLNTQSEFPLLNDFAQFMMNKKG